MKDNPSTIKEMKQEAMRIRDIVFNTALIIFIIAVGVGACMFEAQYSNVVHERDSLKIEYVKKYWYQDSILCEMAKREQTYKNDSAWMAIKNKKK